MKATCNVREGLSVSVEAPTQVELYEELASACEVFGERYCGLCGCTDIYPIYRHVGKLEFAEWGCPCGARLSLGNTMEGGRLFPIRALTPDGKPDREHGTKAEHNGWTKYRGPATENGGPKTPTPQRSAPATTAATPAATQYQPPTRAEAGAPIAAEQWEALQDALKSRFIDPRAFLRRYGYPTPRDIKAKDYDELLNAAQNPDDELRRVQKAGGFAYAAGGRR